MNEIIEELENNNFFVDDSDVEVLKKKLNFMEKAINAVIKNTEEQKTFWKTLYDSYKPGYHNKAIAELCLNYIDSAMESSNNAKSYIFRIKDLNNNVEVGYYMSKYKKEFDNVNKYNISLKEIAKNILTEDKALEEDNSSDEEEYDVEKGIKKNESDSIIP